MNSFKKYPRLNYLFITRIAIIMLFIGTTGYLHNKISENVKLLRTAQFEHTDSPIAKELKAIFNIELNGYERNINSNIILLIIATIDCVSLYSKNESLVKKENKRLEKIENQ